MNLLEFHSGMKVNKRILQLVKKEKAADQALD